MNMDNERLKLKEKLLCELNERINEIPSVDRDVNIFYNGLLLAKEIIEKAE